MLAHAQPGFRLLVFLLIAFASPVLFHACTAKPGGEGGGEGSAKGFGKGGGKKGGGDVPAVVTKAVTKNAPIDIQVIGNAEAYTSISVKPQISGQLVKSYFKEGDFVREGQMLFDIDRRLLEAQLQQAQSQLAKNEAQLQQAIAQAARDQATADYQAQQAKRYADGASQGVFSRDQNDQIQASAKASQQTVAADKAAIDSVKADIAATKATIENLKVQMSYTRITAPISGRTGNVTVKVGNVAAANNTELVVINQIEPIYVSFSVPENQLDEIKKFMAGGNKLQVMASPQDSDQTERGTLTFVDNTVDTTTGTIRLKATFPNTNRNLWPGLFTRVTLRLGMRENAVMVPNQVVQTGQTGTFIYVVKEDRSVEARPVTVGNRVGQDLIIDNGLQAGETVVLDGQLRLAPGMRIAPRDPSGQGGPGGGRRRGAGGPPQGAPDQSAGPAAPQGGGSGDATKGDRPKGERRRKQE
jgi:multidrug efflux system membrane fusion protein